MALRDLFRRGAASSTTGHVPPARKPPPRWAHPNPQVRRKGVVQVKDQTLLATIAQTDEDWDVRLMAARRLRDEALAQRVALEGTQPGRADLVRLRATKMLRGPEAAASLFTELAATASDLSVRLEAAKGTPDRVLAQSVFTDLVRTGDDRIRLWAADELADKVLAQSVFEQLGKKSADETVRIWAARRIEDTGLAETILAEIENARAARNAPAPPPGDDAPTDDGRCPGCGSSGGHDLTCPYVQNLL